MKQEEKRTKLPSGTALAPYPPSQAERGREVPGAPTDGAGADARPPASLPAKGRGSRPNHVRKLRKERLMSQAELARRANLSVGTVDRVEKGFGCRMGTKRKILDALGLAVSDRASVFPHEE